LQQRESLQGKESRWELGLQKRRGDRKSGDCEVWTCHKKNSYRFSPPVGTVFENTNPLPIWLR